MSDSKKSIDAFGCAMTYTDTGGSGDPIVFLHGNFTSSFMWRGIIPHLEGLGRCIAIDNLGMGDSMKLPGAGRGSYRLFEQQVYVDSVLRKLKLGDRVTLVMHDFGAQIGLVWAREQHQRVKGVAYIQAVMGPTRWEDFPADLADKLRTLRSPAGDTLGISGNQVFEDILPAQLSKPLPPEVLAEYQRPFKQPGEGRRPVLTWVRELPFDNQPPDVINIMDRNHAWLSETEVPKLLIKGDPASPFCGDLSRLAAYPNQTEVTLKGAHQLQEDCPDEIGQALADWYRSLGW